MGSLVNKIVIILPIILLLSQFLPWLLTRSLMVGGTYLCFEGAEKSLREARMDRPPWKEAAGADTPADGAAADGAAAEKKIVRSAITTDFVLSCEIMVIALNEVAVDSLTSRAVILIIVALAITLGVCGTRCRRAHREDG